MKYFWSWLYDEAKGFEYFYYIFSVACLSYIFSSLAYITIYHLLSLEYPPRFFSIDMSDWPICFILLFNLGLIFFEELCCRIIPLYCAVQFFKKWGVIVISIIFSAIFGFVHGGFICIFMQGIIGFLFCILYLKCGGIKGKVILPSIVVLFTHIMHNTLVYAGIFLR